LPSPVYLLGHMAMSYLFSWLVAKGRRQKLVLWAALTAGIVPDYDILFSPLGLVHHTYTHSLVLWAPVMFALVYWRRDSLPYVVGILQHTAVGDFLVGRVPFFLPLSDVSVGLNLGMPSAADAILEFGSLILMILVMWRSGDLKRLLRGGRENLLMAVPLLSLVGLTWLAAGTPELGGLVAYGFSRLTLSVVSLGCIVLGGLMLVSMLGGLPGLFHGPPRSIGRVTERKSRACPRTVAVRFEALKADQVCTN
jgi:hypothetical protein